MKINNKSENCFIGIHTEYIFWSALIDQKNKLSDHLKQLVANGKIMYRSNQENIEYAALSFPDKGPVQALTMIENVGEGFEFKEVVPLLRGANFPADIRGSYTWNNPALGEYAVSVRDHILDLFDPFFILDFKSGEKTPMVCLSAVALRLEEFKGKSFVVDKGGFYEHKLEEFLKGNPNKKKKDFKSPEIHLTKATFRMLVPTEYSSEYEIVASIEDIEHTSFLDRPVHILTINLEHTVAKEFFKIPLYVTDKTLNGYVPKIGDSISAIVWFQGYFN